MVMRVPPAAMFGGGFLVGVVTLFVLEALGLYLLIKRLNRKIKRVEVEASSSPASDGSLLNSQQSVDHAFNKKGVVWVLEADKVPKNWKAENVSKEQKRKQEFIEVTPVKKYATIKDRSLILTDPDGSQIAVLLEGCIIEAVSATGLPSRKWAKRFPIKVETTTSMLYGANKVVYIYLETSWEKEAWCKALRLASCAGEERHNWVNKLNEEFQQYLTSLNAGYPSFMKRSVFYSGETAEIDKINRVDGTGSRVRLFLKKLARRASRTGGENKFTSLLSREDKKINDKYRILQESDLAGTLIKNAPSQKETVNSAEDNLTLPSASTLSHSASQTHSSVMSDIDSDDKFNIDEGMLCWNLLISRLFFDAKSSIEVKNSVKTRIQRTLSNMRTPSYIAEVICTDLHLGNLPPYIHGIRVLPMDMNEVWAWEVDIEYCGGGALDIETRLEVRDLDLQKVPVDANSGSTSGGDVPSEFLEGFEYFEEQLNLSEGTDGNVQGPKAMGDPKLDRSKSSTSGMPTNLSRWKSIIHSVAKQVSQVPISLSVRVASLRGTLRVHIKPPPSDQLWYGFTSMPDVEFDLESSLGEHKIASGQIASYLINRFKATIRETVVLPNCDSVTIPWMLGEKNDWVPRKAAPFMWLNQESTSDSATTSVKTEAGRGSSSDHTENKHQSPRNSECAQSDASSNTSNISRNKSLNDLSTPLLESGGEPTDRGQDSRGHISESWSPSRSMIPVEGKDHAAEDDSKPKKIGRRAKMLDLGKKMGEKLEEKRRHIEERGRNIVEKMRGP